MKKLISSLVFLALMFTPTIHCLASDRYGREWDIPGHHAGGSGGWIALIVIIVIGYIACKFCNSNNSQK